MALREISLTLPNRPGTLASVARILAQDRINVAAISVDSSARSGRVRLIVSDPEGATRLLSRHGYRTEVREILAVRLQDRSGSFLAVLDTLAKARVNIQSVAILVARDGNQPLVALSTSNIERARRILTAAGFASPIAERLVSNEELVAGTPVLPSESVGLHL
jgi:hypothetical protein